MEEKGRKGRERGRERERRKRVDRWETEMEVWEKFFIYLFIYAEP